MKRSMLIMSFMMLLVSVFLPACAPTGPVAPNDSSVVANQEVYPESDNKYQWASGSRVTVRTQVYTVNVTVIGDITNNTTINGSGSSYSYNGYGSGRMRIWQDGKGLLPVQVNSISPIISGMELQNATIILKISDLKAMALPDGAQTTFICNLDTEVLSPVQNNQVLTTDRLTNELDNCRMTTSIYRAPATPAQ